MTEKKDASAALGDVIPGVDKFLNAATAGKVWIDGKGIKVDTVAITEALDRIQDAEDQIDALLAASAAGGGTRLSTPFGSNPVGRGMAEKFARRSNGDQYSLTAVLQSYRDQLDKAGRALHASLRDYVAAEVDGATRFRSDS